MRLINKPKVNNKVEITLLQLYRLVKLKGEKVGVIELRKHALGYLKGVGGNVKALNQVETEPVMIKILEVFQTEQK